MRWTPDRTVLVRALAGAHADFSGKTQRSVYFFEDIAVPGSGANHMSIRPLLRMTSTKTMFSYSIVHSFKSLHRYNANLRIFCRVDVYAFPGGYRTSMTFCRGSWVEVVGVGKGRG